MNHRLARRLRYAIAIVAHYSGIDALYRTLTGAGLIVLMLHRLRDTPDPYPLSTSRASFHQLVHWLRAREALTGLQDGLQALADPQSRHLHYAITFDDGYRDNLRMLDRARDGSTDSDVVALPPAVIYVTTRHVGGDPIWVYRLEHAFESRTRDRIDLAMLGQGEVDIADPDERQRLYDLLPVVLKQLAPDALQACVDDIVRQADPQPPTPAREMLDWDDIRRLHAQGVQIGAHTRHHVILAQTDAGSARHEILGSHADISDAIGVPPAHFAYPNGNARDFSERDVALVREAGFTTAVTSIEGINRRGVDRYRILRQNVHEDRYLSPAGQLSAALFFSETSGVLSWLRTRRAS